MRLITRNVNKTPLLSLVIVINHKVIKKETYPHFYDIKKI